MSNVYINKKIVKKGTDKVILRTYDSCYGTFNYYLFSSEGDIILQITDCNCRQIPKVILDKYETFSLENKHAEDRANFKAWLEHEGYKE